jgi:RNase P protein component
MLARKHRISRGEMLALARGRYSPVGSIEYRVVRRAHGPARISCVVPKTIIPQSIDRHAFKRVVYGVFLILDVKQESIDIIIRPKRGWKKSALWKNVLRQSLIEAFQGI